jgi:putative DNA primase/helicase
MRGREEWAAVLAYDEFAKRAVLRNPIPGEAARPNEFPRDLTDADVRSATLSLQKSGIHISSSVATEAMHKLAEDNRFHPVRDYLRGLDWDRTVRLDTWLIDHLGAADTPLNRAVAAKWLVGAVARVEQPGCQMKTILSIEGPQDMGKSTAFKIMAVKPRWFADHISSLASKDSREEVQGKWVIEFAEFDALLRAEPSRVKSFLSTPTDHYRPAYGRVAQDFERQWVGVATINPGGMGYLRDETGGVRFWPVECAVGWPPGRQVDMKALREVRDQLWAEAAQRYRDGATCWIDDEATRLAQVDAAEERTREDAREERIQSLIEDKGWVQMADVMTCLGIEADKWTRSHQTEIGIIIRGLGWVRWKGRFGPIGAGTYYFPKGTADRLQYAREVTAQAEEVSRFVREDQERGYTRQSDVLNVIRNGESPL